MTTHRMTPLRTAAVAALVAISGTASAQNLLTNGSFELGSALVGGFNQETVGSTNITGWTVVVDELAWIHGPLFPLTASDGAKYLDLTHLTAGCSPCGGVAQTITTTPGDAYVLSFDLGSSSTFFLPSAITVAISGVAGTQTFTSTGAGPNNWETFSTAFVAGAGTTTTFTLVGSLAGTANNPGDYVGLDKVSVVATPIPEPGAWALMLAGLATVGSVAARRRVQR